MLKRIPVFFLLFFYTRFLNFHVNLRISCYYLQKAYCCYDQGCIWSDDHFLLLNARLTPWWEGNICSMFSNIWTVLRIVFCSYLQTSRYFQSNYLLLWGFFFVGWVLLDSMTCVLLNALFNSSIVGKGPPALLEWGAALFCFLCVWDELPSGS